MPPHEFVEWMEQEAAASDLWWHLRGGGAASWGRHELEFVAQITDLVHRVAEPSDRLTLEDEEPVTRYAQIMQLGDGLFMVEIARVFEAGAYNWRIGRSRADEDAENVAGDRVTGAQKLTAAETTEVFTSWAEGHGLPLGYGAPLHVYGDVPHPGQVGA
ncbi:hypothetical protein [uncultured Micrococcus sp.]|uniref:hypothetical protein n=1 Tax=uncultured Micrococcus sp. TaxID=114051 RepID=UPI00261FF69D|nr:hypothetical protein [uncultured Micrococcus sp.]